MTIRPVDPGELLTNAETAALLGITPNTLKWWRHLGRGPKFIKFSPSKQGSVGYELADIEAWKAERKVAGTSAYSPAALSTLKSSNSRSSKASA